MQVVTSYLTKVAIIRIKNKLKYMEGCLKVYLNSKVCSDPSDQ